MKGVVFHHQALAEIAEAADSYEAQRAGLGMRFVDVVDACIARLPHRAYVPSLTEFRALGVKATPVSSAGRWPWRVIFLEDEERLFILAVPHNRRRESYWQSRLGDVGER